MQLHDLQPKTPRRKSRQVGRGGKRGKTSGRGHKGQKARAGGSPRPQMRDVIKKLPKKRGYKFPALKEKPVAVNVSELGKHFADGEEVTTVSLFEKRIVSPRKSKGGIKILGGGSLDKKLTLSGLSVSASAREKVEKAGGTIA